MDDQLVQKLKCLNLEGAHNQIIRYASEAVKKQPRDAEARYCLGMAYLAQGDKTAALGELQKLIATAVEESGGHIKIFVGRVILQLVDIAEMALHGGDTIGASTFEIIRSIKSLGQSIGDQELVQGAERILHKWWHRRPAKPPVVALIMDSPLTLQVEPTNACNLNCTMCPRRKMKRKIGLMDPALFAKMLAGWQNKLIKLQIKHLIFGTTLENTRRGAVKLFFMGEPLLHPQLDQLVELGNQAGCIVGLQTNGVALKDETVRHRLLAARPAAIGISLDGISASSYETVREGSRWSEICEGLAALKAEREEMGLIGRVWITVSSIIPERNQTDLDRAKDFLAPIYPLVDRVGFVPLSRDRDLEFYSANEELIHYEKWSVGPVSNKQALCTEPLTKLNVLWDGTITACCYDIDGEMALGHVNDGIDNVWQSAKARALREALLNHKVHAYPLCASCMGKANI